VPRKVHQWLFGPLDQCVLAHFFFFFFVAKIAYSTTEGGIFWCYGLATFARFLGAFSEYGWAWNRIPLGHHVSAEFVESLVIFTYGITNVWMERFGAHAGDPFTTKQLQHISIAVRHYCLFFQVNLMVH
jgi:hypothetical protein